MLDRMIESQNNPAEKFRRGNFLLTTMGLVAMVLSGAMVYSLYAKPLGEMDENLDVSALVALVVATEPAAVEPPKNEIKPASSSKAPQETVRIVNQKSIDESPTIPKEVSITENQYASRSKTDFKIGGIETNASSAPSGNSREVVNTDIGVKQSPKIIENEDTNEPPRVPKSEPKPEQPKKIVSLGVANGVAKNLPTPPYPQVARAVHASGAVNVQILIDETGKVISAKAVSGHPLLRQVAEQAAQRAVFSPTLLSNVPVKATGVIVYNFVAQ